MNRRRSTGAGAGRVGAARGRRRRAGLALMLGLLWCTNTQCTIGEDPLISGELCSITTSLSQADPSACPTEIILSRDTPQGRNAIDFTLQNEGGFAQVQVLAGPPDTDSATDLGGADLPDGGSADLGTTSGGEDSALTAQRSFQLESNASVQDRLTPNELGRQDRVQLSLSCDTPTCAVRLTYVLSVAPLECRASEDCDSGWICDVERGTCAECLSDLSCVSGQVCDRGRCTPQEVGCATPRRGPGATSRGPLDPSGHIVWVLLALMLVLVVWGLRSRRARGMFLALVVAGSLCGGEASARGPEARFLISAGPRIFTGEMGAQTQTGVGLAVGQELRGRYLGLGLDLTTAYFVTKQEPPPLSRSLLLYSAQLGPRLYYPLNNTIELVSIINYERFGLANNSLIRLTGTRSSYNAVLGGLGAQFRTQRFEARVWGGWHVPFGLPGTLVTINLTFVLVGSSRAAAKATP